MTPHSGNRKVTGLLGAPRCILSSALRNGALAAEQTAAPASRLAVMQDAHILLWALGQHGRVGLGAGSSLLSGRAYHMQLPDSLPSCSRGILPAGRVGGMSRP